MLRDAPPSRLRVAARLANGFALDLVKLGGFGRDVIDALLLCAISQANVAQITRNPEYQTRYATLDQPPPDDLRRPVSISATANSLRIPFETARRRIAAMAELGIVIIHPRGVTIPTAPMNSPFYRMASAAHYELVRKLYLRLRGIGLLDDLARPQTSIYDPENPPVRLVTRLSADFVLRLAEPINQHIGDLVTGIVLMSVIQANTEHLPDHEGEAADEDPAAAALAIDALRRPVRASAVAERLGMPHETIRRHLVRLHDADRCERNGDGYVVMNRILAREPFFRHIVDNQSHLHRLYAQLSDYGVLFEWEREVQAFRGAA